MRHVIALICVCATATTVLGQQSDAPPNSPPERATRGGGPNNERLRLGMGMMPGGAADRWLGHLREKDPREFERLIALREKDPQTFHDQMRERLQQEVLSRIERERPRLFKALQSLPPEDHEWLMKRLGGLMEGPRGRGGPSDESPRGPDETDLKSSLAEKLQQYHQAKDPGIKQALKDALRAEIKSTILKRQERRRMELDQLEQRITEMRSQLDPGGTNMEKLIDAKLDELTCKSN